MPTPPPPVCLDSANPPPPPPMRLGSAKPRKKHFAPNPPQSPPPVSLGCANPPPPPCASFDEARGLGETMFLIHVLGQGKLNPVAACCQKPCPTASVLQSEWGDLIEYLLLVGLLLVGGRGATFKVQHTLAQEGSAQARGSATVHPHWSGGTVALRRQGWTKGHRRRPRAGEHKRGVGGAA